MLVVSLGFERVPPFVNQHLDRCLVAARLPLLVRLDAIHPLRSGRKGTRGFDAVHPLQSFTRLDPRVFELPKKGQVILKSRTNLMTAFPSRRRVVLAK